MSDIKATAKTVWVPVGVVAAIVVAVISLTLNYADTRTTAYLAKQQSTANDLKLQDLSPTISDLTAQVKYLNANIEELKKKN